MARASAKAKAEGQSPRVPAAEGPREVHLVPPGASIIVSDGFYSGLEICIDRDWLVIGRGRSADLVFAEPTISRSHAAIGFDQGGFFVQDLGSTNGTTVNGAKAQRMALKDRDVIQMGKLGFGVTLPDPSKVEAPGRA
jgi:pSer/pThr/pTyr-binding forkhead associated (FHA) protein